MLRRSRFYIYIFTFSVLAVLGISGAAHGAPPLKLAPNNIADGTQYVVYAETFTASGGTAPYSWAWSGNLPTGLTFTPSGATANLSGVPGATGTFNFRITVTDSGTPAPVSVFIDYTVVIAASTGACSFVGSNTGAISFGTIDPSGTADPISGTVTQIQITCTAGKAFTVAANPASGWTMVSGVNSLPYTLGFIASGTGAGATPIDLLTTGSQILLANYQNAAGGSYSNSQPVQLTISWTAPPGSLTATLPIGSVSATILNTCVVTQLADTLVFPIDPSAASATGVLTPSGLDMKIKCTNGDPLSISSSSKCGGLAQNGSASCGGYIILYAFTYAPGSPSGLGFGTGLDISLGIAGSTVQANYANAPGGIGYADVQTLTISY